MATPQHFVWAAGHLVLLAASLRYVLASLTFKAASSLWYKASYAGAIVSYAIVCHKSVGYPQPNIAWARRALLDENIQYLLLALFWFTSKPITLTLLPFMIFSLFHALTFLRTTIMSRYMPGPPATAGGPPQPHPMAKKLQAWVKANYDSAMRVVAYTELVIFLRVLLGAVAFQNSLLAPIAFAHFVRQRYFQSAFTREALTGATRRAEALVHREGTPPVVVQVFEKGQHLVQRWAGVALAPNPPAAAAAGARR